MALLAMATPYLLGLVMVLLTGFVLLVAVWNDWFTVGRRRSVWMVVLLAAEVGISLYQLLLADRISQCSVRAFHQEAAPSNLGISPSPSAAPCVQPNGLAEAHGVRLSPPSPLKNSYQAVMEMPF